MARIRYKWQTACTVAGMVIVAAAVTSVVKTDSDFSGRVVQVIDGDTIAIDTESGRIKVRIWGIDAPEIRQEFGPEAAAIAAKLCGGEEVSVRVVDHDRYGRVVGEVTLSDGRDFGNEMIRAGAAWWAIEYARGDREKERLQGQAQNAGTGLWGRSPCDPPWEFRSRRRHSEIRTPWPEVHQGALRVAIVILWGQISNKVIAAM